MIATIRERRTNPVFTRHRGPITCVAGVPGTHSVVTSGYDGAVGWFDLDTGRVDLLGYHRHLVNRVAPEVQPLGGAGHVPLLPDDVAIRIELDQVSRLGGAVEATTGRGVEVDPRTDHELSGGIDAVP